MRNRSCSAVLVTFAAITLAGFAQATPPPQQGRPVERLSVFEGTWGREGTPTDKFKETCAWLAGGRRHLVCDTETQRPDGASRMLRVHSYRGGTYTVFVAIGDGPTMTYAGGSDGDRWIFNLQSDRPDNPQRLRQIITPTKDRIRFVEESSENGGPWKTTEDYSYVRVK
jgi:hypothetical protein